MTILQQEHYEIGRFLKWVFTHFFTRQLPRKKPVVWTMKARALIVLSILQILAFFVLSVFFGLPYAIYSIRYVGLSFLVIGFLFLLNPWLPLSTAQALLLPLEKAKKRKTISAAAAKLRSFPHLTVVGIAGSYGKTSMKTILAHVLKGKKSVLATPLSHNVPMGVAEAIDLELDQHYEVFVVEMGEFYRGDIRELCEMVRPAMGIITGLNSQHAQRLGTIEEAGTTLFELQEYLQQRSEEDASLHVFVNEDDENIRRYVASHELENEVLFYGSEQSDFWATNIHFTEAGTSFDLRGHNLPRTTCHLPLLGSGQVTNVLGALTVAKRLGVSEAHVLKRLESLPQIPHRLERTVWNNGLLLIDDAYNSNVDGFQQALDVLGRLSRANKILVTPGIIELGEQTKEIHADLGELANEVCETIVLVGTSDRTEALASTIDQTKIVRIRDIAELWLMTSTLCPDPKDSVLLLENDLPESGM